MEQVDYTKIVPTQPPDGFKEWFWLNNMDDEEYLVYRAARYTDPLSGEKIRGVECTCTSCTETSLMQRIDAQTDENERLRNEIENMKRAAVSSGASEDLVRISVKFQSVQDEIRELMELIGSVDGAEKYHDAVVRTIIELLEN